MRWIQEFVFVSSHFTEVIGVCYSLQTQQNMVEHNTFPITVITARYVAGKEHSARVQKLIFLFCLGSLGDLTTRLNVSSIVGAIDSIYSSWQILGWLALCVCAFVQFPLAMQLSINFIVSNLALIDTKKKVVVVEHTHKTHTIEFRSIFVAPR